MLFVCRPFLLLVYVVHYAPFVVSNDVACLLHLVLDLRIIVLNFCIDAPFSYCSSRDNFKFLTFLTLFCYLSLRFFVFLFIVPSLFIYSCFSFIKTCSVLLLLVGSHFCQHIYFILVAVVLFFCTKCRLSVHFNHEPTTSFTRLFNSPEGCFDLARQSSARRLIRIAMLPTQTYQTRQSVIEEFTAFIPRLTPIEVQ